MQLEASASRPKTSSRMGLGCLVLFGLPFLAVGLLTLWQGIRDYGAKSDSKFLIIFGLVFALAGAAVMLAGFFGSSAQRKKSEREIAHPGEPWMWSEEWANRSIRDSNRAGAIGMWVFAVLWNAIAFPITWVALPQFSREQPMVLIVLIFPLAGVILLLVAIYQTLRSMKFGTSICHLEGVPIVPGRLFRGDIELKTDAAPADGYRLRLASVRVVTTGSGKSRSTTEHVLWDEETVVDATAVMRSPMGTRVPFQFATPPDSHPTDEQDSSDRYVWRLSATAQLPGVDYAAQFDLPVFQTGETVDGAEFAAFQERHRAEAARHPIRPTSGVAITKLSGGGQEYRIHANKTVGGVISSLIFLAVWNAAIAAMIHFEAPWGVPAVFIALDILFIISALDYFLGRSTITVDASGVRVLRQWSGLASKEKAWPASDIVSIDATSVAAGTDASNLTLKLRDGRTQAFGSNLPDRESAEAVAAKMMADLGRT